MKSIIYALLAIFILGIIATGFTHKPNTSHSILIQATDSLVSSASLSQSATIITNRLKNFSSAKSDVTAIQARNQILVTLDNTRDLEVIQKLITQKGKLEFYETWSFRSLADLFSGDSILTSILRKQSNPDSSPRIVCTSVGETNRLNRNFNDAGMKDKCRFAWSDLFEKNEVCLYALKTGIENRIPLGNSDIESVESKLEKSLQKESIMLKFRKEAVQVWADATRRNLNSSIAIVLDNHVMYAPMVRSEINGGNCQITGDFNSAEVKYIAAIGNNGELPVIFTVVK